MSITSAFSGIQQLPVKRKRAIGIVLAAAALAYLTFVAIIYWRFTAPSSLCPDLTELDRTIFESNRPSLIEQMLDADGERIENGGTMRPAFTVDSQGWERKIENLTESERNRLLQEREGERQALLHWARSGASREAFARDDHPWHGALPGQITSAYLVTESASGLHVRIRSLINDRCVTCHSENGRHDTARYIPFNSYEQLEPRLKPQAANSNRALIIAAFVGLCPLGFVSGLGFWNTAHSLAARALLVALTFAALALMLMCFLLGRHGPWHRQAFIAAAVFAALLITAQCIAIFGDLLKQTLPPDGPKSSFTSDCA